MNARVGGDLPAPDLLLATLRDPRGAARLRAAHWSALVREARKHDLLGRLAGKLEEAGQTAPHAPRAHLESAQLLAGAQHREVRREVARLLALLRPQGIPLILLKGAAYVHAGLPAARGRMFSDIDVLVPKKDIPVVEAALMLEGWATTHHSAYDQHYYRQWMHEIPPMRQIRRGTVLDVHHAILPETARLRPDPALLWEGAVPVAGMPGLYVLGETDMVLHSMVHLLCNEEFTHGLRDLSDIDLLLRHFGARPGYWESLHARGRQLGVERLLYHGLAQARALLGTPVPGTLLEALAGARPPGLLAPLMDALWGNVLSAGAAGRGRAADTLQRFALYLRAHWLRMPLWLLAGHVLVKALVPRSSE